MNKYKIGYYYERKTVQYLRKAGWDAWRTPASKTAIDVVAIKPDKVNNRILVKLIQIKATSNDKFSFTNLSRKERASLLELALRYKDYDNVNVELWVYYRKKRKREIIDIKKLL